MSSDHAKAPWRSLRLRLTAWNTTVVLFAVVVAMIGVREGLRLTLLHEVDQVLKDDTTEVALAVEQFYPNLAQAYNEMDRKTVGHVDRGLFVQFLDPNGRALWSSPKMPSLEHLPQPAGQRPTLFDVDHCRVAQRRLNKPGMPAFTVRVGSSLEPVEEDVARLTKLVIVAVLAVLCVAPLGGYWLAGRATRPLARIIATTARLRPSHMEERLPIRGTGDELDRLSATINRFLDLIGEYLDRSREFVANAAHELRSPLAAIQSSVEVTLNSDRSIPEYQELLDDIAAQCGALGGLVNQLLLLAETDAARFQIESHAVPFDRLLERSVDMFRGAAEERGIQLTANYPSGLICQGDGDRLRQVINNLIDNSLKFTPRGGRVHVAAERDEARRQLVLRVTDTGAGIAPEDLPHVFERFYRGDKSRRRENPAHGNGLGLSICQSIVAAHNGTISVESRPGAGAEFTVRIPLGEDPLTQTSPVGLATVRS
jgi:signal transduction histidine kinase